MNDHAVWQAAQGWLAQGRDACIVRVSGTQGSVPRLSGTRMLVAAGPEGEAPGPTAATRLQPAVGTTTGTTRGTTLGTIGGGHLELKAIQHALALLNRQAQSTELELPLGPALGQCCGGVVRLSFEPLSAETLATWPQPQPLFHLQLYGAGHVGQAIARALEPLHVRVDWIDERDDAFSARPAAGHIRRVAVDAVEAEVAHAPPGACYLVLTHSHDLDLAITQAILQRGDFSFLGLIGSATKRARFVHRFEQRGISAAVLERLTCPIGWPGIQGKEPEVIAASVVAQLLQHMHC